MGSPLAHKHCQRLTFNFPNLAGSGHRKWTQPTAIRPERSQWGQLRGRLNKEGAGEALRLTCKLLTYLDFLCPPAHLADIAILY